MAIVLPTSYLQAAICGLAPSRETGDRRDFLSIYLPCLLRDDAALNILSLIDYGEHPRIIHLMPISL